MCGRGWLIGGKAACLAIGGSTIKRRRWLLIAVAAAQVLLLLLLLIGVLRMWAWRIVQHTGGYQLLASGRKHARMMMLVRRLTVVGRGIGRIAIIAGHIGGRTGTRARTGAAIAVAIGIIGAAIAAAIARRCIMGHGLGLGLGLRLSLCLRLSRMQLLVVAGGVSVRHVGQMKVSLQLRGAARATATITMAKLTAPFP